MLEAPKSWEVFWRDFLKTSYSDENEKAKSGLLKEFRRVEISSLHMEYENLSKRLIYLPIYVTSYRHDGKTYPVFVNGRTGAIYADRPFGVGTFVPKLLGLV